MPTLTPGNDIDLQSMFTVKRVDKSFRNVVPRRAQPVRPFAGVSNSDANWMKVHAYEHAGLEEYNACWTGEMSQRPIPFVSTDSKPLYAQELFERYIGVVFNYLLPRIKPHIQPINKVSSLGYPISANPGTGLDPATGIQTHLSKFDIVLEQFKVLQTGDFSAYQDSYHTIGVRKQNESPDKKRTFQFITSEGRIIQKDITRKDRLINVNDVGIMVGSRTRTITRPPVINLWIQCWDSMLHDAIMDHPLCDSNVYTHRKWPTGANFRTFDCRHFERYLGLAAISYADAVGGNYGMILNKLIHDPFIVPSNDWKTFFEITPSYRQGVYPQFSSGLAPVAPLGKLTNICAQVAFFVEVKGMDATSAVSTVFSGTSEGLQRWMYGDDNRLLGSNVEIDLFIKHMSSVFDIELDEQPKYLGTIYRRDLDEFMLPRSTYNLKLYQPERDYDWKEYPNLGMTERREVFQRFGEPEIANDIIPFENDLWDHVNHPWHQIVADAVTEKRKATTKGINLSALQVTDKSYLMNDAQMMASGQFWHLKDDVTASIALSLVGDAVREKLTFKTAPFVPVPEPQRRLQPYESTVSEDVI